MKKLILLSLTTILFSGCSNYEKNAESSEKQVQGSYQVDKSNQDAELHPAHICLTYKAEVLKGKKDLTNAEITMTTNAKTLRKVVPGETVTEEHQPDRINIVADPNTGKILDAWCG